MAAPAKVYFSVVQGTTFNKEVILSTRINGTTTPINITGYGFELTIKKTFNSPVAVALSVGNGITITTAAEGKLTLKITDEQTAVLAAGKYVYNFDWEDTGGNKFAIYSGDFEVIRSANV